MTALPSMKFYTIGYGGRRPADLATLLVEHDVRSVADVRIRPDRASTGAYAKARTPDKGIEKLLADRGIVYRSILELGNMFRDLDDWHGPYRELFDRGPVVSQPAGFAPSAVLPDVAEKKVSDCHRLIIADFLVATRGWTVEHIE